MLPSPVHTVADYWKSHVLPSGLSRHTIEQLSQAVSVVSGEREQITVSAPFTAQRLGSVPNCTPEDVYEAVRRARRGQQVWANRSFADRRSILLRFHDSLLSRREQVLDLIQLEAGKARAHALEEVLDTALVARHYALHGEEYLRTSRRQAALPLLTAAWEHRHPVGVAGFISPWNFPLTLSITDLLPALMAANSAVLRPDTQSPLTALWAADLLYQAGLPRDVLQVVTGEGRVLGPALVNAVDFIMFTGSTRTGKLVARQAAERLIGFSLELGGKNPMIVTEDADIDAAVDGLVRGAFVGAGQVCVSIERAYVQSRIFEAFAIKLAERVRRMKLSSELAYGVDMGSLASESQLGAVTAHVQDAVAKGAVIIAGGRARPDLGPFFYEPTVLTGVTPEMRVFAEETFGPVVSLCPFTSLGEAVERANDTSYGLNASIWSSNSRKARKIGRQIKAGTVNINEIYASTWTTTAAPIGGMKQSGFGRRHGAEGILKYTEAQTIAVQRLVPIAPPKFLPERFYGSWMPRFVRLLRHVPGMR